MLRAILVGLGVCSLTLVAFVARPTLRAAEPNQEPPLRLGITDSLFRDVPRSQNGSGRKIFSALMKAQTGLSNELAAPAPVAELAQQLEDGRLDFAIVQGVEFAWARQQHPRLRSLLILVNERPYRRAHLVVRQDSDATCWAELKGKALAVPAQSREHCLLFYERPCKSLGQEPEHFFAKILKTPTLEDALDDVIEGQAQAAVVDEVGLEAYARRKPGRFAKLKELARSELFPDSVVAYRAGALDEHTLHRCREGLLGADKQAQGRLLLMFWRVTSFAPLPAGFEDRLVEIAKAYPAPSQATASKPSTRRIPTSR
jgi:ABC-type phosphate/phosphonate transport system substrate-binding protein